MAKATYVIIRNCKLPSVVVDNRHPHKPNQVSFRTFRKGDIINGELKHQNNQPAFILSEGIVVPLYCVKAIVTKEIMSEATGEEKAKAVEKKVAVETVKKVKYLDYAIIGAVVGVGAVYLAHKKDWIKTHDNKHYAYGAIAGALLGAYIVYRTKSIRTITPKSE